MNGSVPAYAPLHSKAAPDGGALPGAGPAPAEPGPAAPAGGVGEWRFWTDYGFLLSAFWVVFLVFPVLAVALSGLPPGLSILGYALIAAFGSTYLYAFYRDRSDLGSCLHGTPTAQRCFWILLGVSAAGIPLLGVNTLGYSPFIISYAAYLLSRRTMWWTTSTTLVASVAVAVGTGQVQGFAFLLGILFVLAIVNALTTTLIRRGTTEAQLQMENLKLMEQERMARDVHDALGHSLTAVGLKAQLAQRLLDTDIEAARAELEQIRALTVDAMDSIRATVGGTRRTTPEEELAAVRSALDDAGVRTVTTGTPVDCAPEHATALSWILREAVTNVVRHAHATTCWITFGPTSLSIEDDGDSLTGAPEGNGIRGMRERARLHGARCDFGVSGHGGARVELSW